MPAGNVNGTSAGSRMAAAQTNGSSRGTSKHVNDDADDQVVHVAVPPTDLSLSALVRFELRQLVASPSATASAEDKSMMMTMTMMTTMSSGQDTAETGRRAAFTSAQVRNAYRRVLIRALLHGLRSFAMGYGLRAGMLLLLKVTSRVIRGK